MKIIYKAQIIIIHLWFITSAYLMLTEEKREYIGQEEPDSLTTLQIVFYLSLLVLALFYLAQLAKYIERKK